MILDRSSFVCLGFLGCDAM